MIAPDEWESISLLIEEGWPGEFTDSASTAWRVFLDDYDAAQVLTALKAMVARGGKFRPSVAEVAAQIHHDASIPTFSEMVRLIFGSRGVLSARTQDRRSSWGPGERDRADRTAMLQRAAGMHPLVVSFISREGLERLRSLNLNDEEWGDARRRQLQARWEQHVEVSEDRDVAALVAPRRGEMAKLDPLAALGLQVPVAALERGGEV